MLRSEIITSVKSLASTLETSNVEEVISLVIEASRSQNVAMVTKGSLTTYSFLNYQYEHRFGPLEKKLVEILELTEIFSIDWWVKVAAPDDKKSDVARGYYRNSAAVRNAKRLLPQIVALFDRGHIDEQYDAATSHKTAVNENPNFTLILPEERGAVSNAKRVSNAIDAVVTLYEALALFLNVSENGLSLTSCDSGSDKIFDFSGLGEVIKQLESLLLSAWTSFIYHRERKFAERLKLVSSSLPIIAQLAEMESDGKIDRERCEIIRRGLISGVEKFLETGSNIPQMSGNSVFVPRQLLRAGETLLLDSPPSKDGVPLNVGEDSSEESAGGDEHENESSGVGSFDVERLTPEQLRQELRRLQGKSSLP